jgi:cellulose synthase/poly-beta-1,6-N-acetylglucosamine synthase-like glycosyltransferase
MMPEPVLIVITVLYLIQVGFFLFGLKRIRDKVNPVANPFVSVIIAARNEERNLPECLNSVLRQTYPSDKFEVIVANDNSSDGTAAICSKYASQHPNLTSFVTVNDPVLLGKANALAQAIERSKGEVVLITDADCVVPSTWVEQTARRYSPEVGLVGGVTLQKAKNAFEGMQSLDWAYILGIASSTASVGIPLGSIGNNLSFRKCAYDEVGGYRKLKFSVTEDYTLVQAILNAKKWRYLYPVDESLLVESLPCPTFRELIQQKHRWGKGGLDMKLLGFVIMVIGFGMHAALLWYFITSSLASTTAALLVKFVADYMFLYRVLSLLKKTDELRYFYWFELYYSLYVLSLPFIVFFGGKVWWKGRHY